MLLDFDVRPISHGSRAEHERVTKSILTSFGTLLYYSTSYNCLRVIFGNFTTALKLYSGTFFCHRLEALYGGPRFMVLSTSSQFDAPLSVRACASK